MVVGSGNEITYDDDATQLVLDIVQKVLEPAIKEQASQQRTAMYKSRQNCYINANINYLNMASVNINYKRWSNNDCTTSQPTNYINYGLNGDPALFTREEIVLRTTKYNRHHQTNFWDRYSSNGFEEHYSFANNNRNNYVIANQQFVNQNYMNSNKTFPKSSWRDNSINGNNNYHPATISNFPNQQLPRMDNSYFQYRKNNRKYCSFCRKNGESYEFYTSHSLYENGKAACPVLKQCICNICGQNGHTMSHCSLNASKNSILKMIHRFNAMK